MPIIFSDLAFELASAHHIARDEVVAELVDETLPAGPDYTGEDPEITDDDADAARSHFAEIAAYWDRMTGGVTHSADTTDGTGEFEGLTRAACVCGWRSGGYYSTRPRAFSAAQRHVREAIVAP